MMMIGFGGYLVIGLIIGCAYDQMSKIVPLFVVFYGLMQSSGNFGPVRTTHHIHPYLL